MKITDVRTVLLTGPYSRDPYILAVRPRRSAAFIEIHTDVGIVGVGETYAGYFFGEIPIVKRNFSLVIVVVIVISIMPAVIEVLRARRSGQKTGH